MKKIKKIEEIVFEPVEGLTMEQWIRIGTTRFKQQQDKINEIIKTVNLLSEAKK